MPLDGFGYADMDGDLDAGRFDIEGKERVETFGASLLLQNEFDWGTIASISSYQKVIRDTLEDTDASPNGILTNYAREKPRSFTQEIRVQSDSDGRFNWIAGAFYLNDHLPTDSAFDILRSARDPSGPFNGADPANLIGVLRYPYTQKTESYAIFGQGDYDFTEKLTATVGLRYSHDKISMKYHSFFEEPGPVIIADLVNIDDQVSFSDLSYRFALNYKLDDGTLLYGSFSKGYNAGGFPGGSAASPAELAPYQPEHLYAYEVGAKTELFDRRMRVNTSAFYYDYQDIQVFILDFLGDSQIPVQRKGNAEGAEVYGLEAELQAVPVQGLELMLAGAYTHSKYRSFPTDEGDLAGRQLVSTPRFSASASVSYTFDLGEAGDLTGRLEGFYSDRVYFLSDNDRAFSQGPYANANAGLTYNPLNQNWNVGLWVKNLTDERTLVTASKLITMDELSYTDPRTYGIRFGLHF